MNPAAVSATQVAGLRRDMVVSALVAIAMMFLGVICLWLSRSLAADPNAPWWFPEVGLGGFLLFLAGALLLLRARDRRALLAPLLPAARNSLHRLRAQNPGIQAMLHEIESVQRRQPLVLDYVRALEWHPLERAAKALRDGAAGGMDSATTRARREYQRITKGRNWAVVYALVLLVAAWPILRAAFGLGTGFFGEPPGLLGIFAAVAMLFVAAIYMYIATKLQTTFGRADATDLDLLDSVLATRPDAAAPIAEPLSSGRFITRADVMSVVRPVRSGANASGPAKAGG